MMLSVSVTARADLSNQHTEMTMEVSPVTVPVCALYENAIYLLAALQEYGVTKKATDQVEKFQTAGLCVMVSIEVPTSDVRRCVLDQKDCSVMRLNGYIAGKYKFLVLYVTGHY